MVVQSLATGWARPLTLPLCGHVGANPAQKKTLPLNKVALVLMDSRWQIEKKAF